MQPPSQERCCLDPPEGSMSGSDLIKRRSARNRIDNNKTSEPERVLKRTENPIFYTLTPLLSQYCRPM